MKHLARGFLIVLLLLPILYSGLLINRVNAQEKDLWYTADAIKCLLKAGEDTALCLAAHTAAIYHAGETFTIEQILGCVGDVTRPAAECLKAPEDQLPSIRKINENSFLRHGNRMLLALYDNPPVRASEGIADLGRTFGILPQNVYAQGPGIGFSGLAPLLPIWKVFRNIAYILIAVIMVVIGFMIMFRKKIDPKTVITVQNALPGIVVTLFLITFSYAIVGIMIDVMYTVMVLLLTFLKNSTPGALGNLTAYDYLGGNIGGIGKSMFFAGASSLKDVLTQFAPFAGTTAAATGVGALTLLFAGSPIIGPIGVALIAIPALIVLLVAIVLLFAIIRLYFTLLTAYIQIIIAVLIAPLQLLMGAIPGNNAFVEWFKNLVANLLVFPVSAVLIMIASLLSHYEYSGAATNPIWTPPIIGGTGQGVSALISLGILLSIPSIVNGIKESLKAKSPISIGGAGGQIAGIMGTASQYGIQYAMTKSQIDQMRSLVPKPAEGGKPGPQGIGQQGGGSRGE